VRSVLTLFPFPFPIHTCLYFVQVARCGNKPFFSITIVGIVLYLTVQFFVPLLSAKHLTGVLKHRGSGPCRCCILTLKPSPLPESIQATGSAAVTPIIGDRQHTWAIRGRSAKYLSTAIRRHREVDRSIHSTSWLWVHYFRDQFCRDFGFSMLHLA
jgi:hypothetical protein